MAPQDATPKNLARLLARRQTELGLSRYELAKRAKLFRSGIQRVMDGQGSPQFETVARIAEALKLRIQLVPIEEKK